MLGYRPLGLFFRVHLAEKWKMEKIAIILIYYIFVTKQKFFINEHQKNFDPHVSCRLGRVMANQHIFKTRLNLYFLNQIDLNAAFLMELNFINTLGLGEGGYSSSGAVTRRCSVKNAFLKISQNSHENISIKTSVLLKKRLRCRCFPVNFSKFLRTPFL